MSSEQISTAELVGHYQAGERPRSWGDRLRRAFARMRYQLAGGLVVAVAAPVFLRQFVFGELGEPYFARNSVMGCLWALLFGFLVFRKLTAFPGVQASAYIAPIFLASFGITMAAFVGLGIHYSRFQMFSSFLLTTAFFHLMFFVARNGAQLTMQAAPFGTVDRLLRLRTVRWNVVNKPEDVDKDRPLVVDLRADLPHEWERFITEQALAGGTVYNAKQVFESLSGRVQVEHLSENTFGSLLPNSIYAAAKRQLDFLVALIGAIVLLPVMLVIAIMVRLDSAGPSIYAQKRMGYRGRPFTILKFRTMRKDADKMGASAQMTEENDPRITRFGRFLRKTRLDELPQIFNILAGQMSWIGPRPEARALAEMYAEQLPFYAYRHIVRPGLSGWAQVNQGHVTSVEDVNLKLQFDFFYVKNFSLWLDLLVLLKTIQIIFSGKGAK